MADGGSSGLCGTCAFQREIVSDRGSVFLMCRKALDDNAFAKYPRLPVLQCAGFLALGAGETGEAIASPDES